MQVTELELKELTKRIQDGKNTLEDLAQYIENVKMYDAITNKEKYLKELTQDIERNKAYYRQLMNNIKDEEGESEISDLFDNLSL